jgi:sugar/nucleoside kinase (ribokinase family)
MILSCGEALIDMLPRTSTAGEACFAPYAGGAVFNTAIALGRLGAPSAFFSGVSTDMLGKSWPRRWRPPRSIPAIWRGPAGPPRWPSSSW